ncbi:hypothetical protein CSKR_100982, partial [Clonorchis sinensis]
SRGARWLNGYRENLPTGTSVVRTRPLPLAYPCLGLGQLVVSQPSYFLLAAWHLGIERMLQLNDSIRFSQFLTTDGKCLEFKPQHGQRYALLMSSNKNETRVQCFSPLVWTHQNNCSGTGGRFTKVKLLVTTFNASKKKFSCNALLMPSCRTTRRKHEAWDTAKLPKPRQGKSRGRGRVRTTDLPIGKFALLPLGPSRSTIQERDGSVVRTRFTVRKVRGSNPTSGSRLRQSRLGQPGNILDLVHLSGGKPVRHRKDAAAERFFHHHLHRHHYHRHHHLHRDHHHQRQQRYHLSFL